jgi:hypothetical protein
MREASMHRFRPARRRSLLSVVIVSALLVVATSGCGGESTAFQDPYAALRDSVGTYLKSFPGSGAVKVYRNEHDRPRGYVKGKVVLVESELKALSVFHDDLPGALRATTPEEVGTVVVIRQSWKKVGKYSDGEPALQDIWRITVVDLARGKVVGRALLRGDHPSFMADTSAGENYGDPPWHELVAYLRELPRR